MSRDIPIIYSAPMVRGLLNGSKTQTRRILKPQPKPFLVDGGKECEVALEQLHDEPRPRVRLGNVITTQEVRYAPGDRLWVREAVACGACAPSAPKTWAASFWRREQGSPENRSGLWYRADGLSPRNPITERGAWVPSIHMPRWVSRLTLIVTGVKVERLNTISRADALAEGCKRVREHCYVFDGTGYDRAGLCHSAPETAFACLWDELHGRDAWQANPFVVAITFRVIKANIDAPEARAA